MKVFQFMSIDELEELGECFFYPGTHDNETLKGWIEGLDDYQVESYRNYFKNNLPLNQAIISYCLHSNASDVIIPIWDLLEAVSYTHLIQSCSYLTIASTASTNISSGNSAIQIRLLELIILRAFISGLNNVISPLGLRYAFNPSNVS